MNARSLEAIGRHNTLRACSECGFVRLGVRRVAVSDALWSRGLILCIECVTRVHIDPLVVVEELEEAGRG